MPMMETCKKPWSGWSNDPRSLRHLSNAVGADGITPAQFLASGQRASGVHERPNEDGLRESSFFSII